MQKSGSTPSEAITYRGYEKECDEAQGKLDRLKGLKKREERIDEDADHPHRVTMRAGVHAQAVNFAPIRRWREAFGHEPEIIQGFRNNGEWIQALHTNDHSTRLQPLLRTISRNQRSGRWFCYSFAALAADMGPGALNCPLWHPMCQFFPMRIERTGHPGMGLCGPYEGRIR